MCIRVDNTSVLEEIDELKDLSIPADEPVVMTMPPPRHTLFEPRGGNIVAPDPDEEEVGAEFFEDEESSSRPAS
jgi:hypothetical protein